MASYLAELNVAEHSASFNVIVEETTNMTCKNGVSHRDTVRNETAKVPRSVPARDGGKGLLLSLYGILAFVVVAMAAIGATS